MLAIKKEYPAPCRTDLMLFAKSLDDLPRRVLANPIKRRWLQRGRALVATTIAPVIFGAGSGHHHTLPAMTREGLQQGQCRRDPIEICRRCPELARLGVPGQMKQMRGANACKKKIQIGGFQQIQLMPMNAVLIHCAHVRARRYCMHLEASGNQRRQCMTTDKAACARHNNPFHDSHIMSVRYDA